MRSARWSKVNNANVIQDDIEASNGVMNIIKTVMIP
ncbi:fasciclin domain-containing protein [Methanococcoides seepicolus]